MATLAMFVALGGTGYAATVVTRHGDGTVARKKGKKKPTVIVKCAATGVTCLGSRPGPAGPQGPQGVPGAQGPQGPATGPAGGDLTGNYPNPTIAPGKVTGAALAPNAVSGSNVAAGSLRVSNLAVWSQAYQIAPLTVAAGACSVQNYGSPTGIATGDIPVVRASSYLPPNGIYLNASLYDVGGGSPAVNLFVCNATGSSIMIPYPFTPTIYGLR